jgi:transcription elongation factor Elf1
MKKIVKCPECNSTDIYITSNPKGEVFAVTCENCGYEYESEKFQSLAQKMDDIINNFDRSDLLNTQIRNKTKSK